jgi:hypothetical protein
MIAATTSSTSVVLLGVWEVDCGSWVTWRGEVALVVEVENVYEGVYEGVV